MGRPEPFFPCARPHDVLENVINPLCAHGRLQYIIYWHVR